MCGIAGIHNLNGQPVERLEGKLRAMNKIQAHRGPDGEGVWLDESRCAGFAHRRLSIIDLATGAQPMTDVYGNTIVFNGEIYNYIELREELKDFYEFKTASDTETILAAFKKWGADFLSRVRGMFSFAIWSQSERTLFCARDRFGIKPFYYAVSGGVFYFASEAKALMPFIDGTKLNTKALHEYLVFQFCLDGHTLLEDISELQPAHSITIKNGSVSVKRYWEVYYDIDNYHTSKYFEERLRHLLEESIRLHLRSDVPVGAYLSGGVDSTLIAAIASKSCGQSAFNVYHGKFTGGAEYDESEYARIAAKENGMTLHEVEIGSSDFADTIRKVIYHLDFPVAGPGSFPQYHVSKLASQTTKVVLGGQGGDEVFGGYVRYMIAYFEQCIKGAIDGTLKNGNFVVTYESIIPNLVMLQNYKPLLKEFWRKGLFEDLDSRYYHLINRAPSLESEIKWDALGGYSPFEAFQTIFNCNNVVKEAYFDKMTHFDFKTLLPALLQVEDRMSMAHGLESRVPFLDHHVVEFAATMGADIKFKDGTLKMVLKNAMRDYLPAKIASRKDKMGFPVPLSEWINADLKEFVTGIFEEGRSRRRDYFNYDHIIKSAGSEPKFGRKVWGLLSLELWHQEFLDKALEFKKLGEAQ